MIELNQDQLTAVAIATVRIILGILFFFQGFDKIFRLKNSEIMAFVPSGISDRVSGKTNLLLIKSGAWLELIGGILLVAGFLIQPALIILAFDLVMVSFAFSLAVPIWDLRHVFPRLAMLVFLLLSPAEADVFSLDYVSR